MDRYIEVIFKEPTKEQADILIAQLSLGGFDGFEETDDELKGFIKKEQYEGAFLQKLAAANGLSFTVTEIENRNWNKEWEANFQPVIIDGYITVRAEFHEPVSNVQFDIIITPKMSFGTGHHATTYMMIQEMRDIDFTGKAVFDFGTGTGVLAILASKSGAVSVMAIDNDEWSIQNAAESIAKNKAGNIELKLSGVVFEEKSFDIILANITKNIILENFSILCQQLNKNGTLLLSGLLKGDENEILLEARKHSLILHKVQQQGNWLCMRFLR